MANTAAELIPPFDPSISVESLPLMAWVIVLSPAALAQYGETLEHIQCYCLLHGIPFHVQYNLGVSWGHFFTTRHYSVAKYLRRYQWVLVTDGDMLIANSSVDPRKVVLESPSADVIFSNREGREVCACSYIVHNSPGGWSFLRRWIAWGQELHPNGDNGDLEEIIVAGLKPGPPSLPDGTGRMTWQELDPLIKQMDKKEAACINHEDGSNFWGRYAAFLRCSSHRLRSHRTKEPWSPWFDFDLFTWTDALPPIKMRIYREFSGFTRSIPDSNVSFTRHHPGDWLYHGFKSARLQNASMSLCTGDPWVFQPESTQEQIDEFFHDFGKPYNNHRCWDTSGNYLCNKDVVPDPMEVFGMDDEEPQY